MNMSYEELLSEEINRFYFMALLDIMNGTTKEEMQLMMQFYEELEMYEACAGILKELKKIIKHETGIDLNDEDILKSQRREYVESRGMYCTLLREMTNLTLTSIGRSLKKDHTTVLYSLENFVYWLKNDPHLEKSYIQIKLIFKKYLQLKDTPNLDELIENYLKLKKEYKKLYEFYSKSNEKNKPEIENFVKFL
jgi:hypothetical protein